MKTIHFKVEYDSKDSIDYDSRVYSSIVRFSLELFFKGLSTAQVYQLVIKKFKLNSHLCNCALREGYAIYKSELLKQKEAEKNNRKYYKPSFGNLVKLNRGLITKEDYLKQRNKGLFSEGETGCNGNRLFSINIKNQNIPYKRSRKEHIVLKIKEKLSSKRLRLLESLYITMENRLSPVSFRIRGDNLYISYDESIVESYRRFKDLKQNRILGLDLNPNYIGLSILEFNNKDEFKIIHKRVYDLSDLNESASKNKTKFELQQIDNEILNLCKHYKVSKLVVEDLKFKKDNRFWSKSLNRFCKNKFRFSQIKQHLNTLCNIFGVEFIEINAIYSSFVGNFTYGNKSTPDMVASSIEIARRGYKKFQKEWFYPPMITLKRIQEVLGNQWKKELKLSYEYWKTFFNQIKKLGLKYRFQLDSNTAVFSKNYYKKKTNLYCFS